jgi:hypothetical protein
MFSKLNINISYVIISVRQLKLKSPRSAPSSHPIFLQLRFFLQSIKKMFGFGEARDAYDQVQGYDQNQEDNQASLTHEAIAAAASFEVRITCPRLSTCFAR